MPRFGENLRLARERAALTQEALAAKLGFKQSAPLSIWETSDTIPTPKTIVKLAAALECTTGDLLAGVVTPYDALRGSVEVGDSESRSLSAAARERERTLLRNFRELPEANQLHLYETIATLAKYFRAARRGTRRRSPSPKQPNSAERQAASPERPPRTKRR